MHKPSVFMGAVMGALLTAPLLALLYLAAQVAKLPFVPYDFFDWLGRVLPGRILIRGIESMVQAIERLHLGETSSTAKTLENLMGILSVLAIGVVAGAVFFAVRNRVAWPAGGSRRHLPGVLLAILVGVPLILISRHIVYGGDTLSDLAPESVSVLWLAAAFLAWGIALNDAYERLSAPLPEPIAAVPDVSAWQLDRRSFLIQMGTATATITVLGAGIGRYLAYREDRDYKNLINARRAAAAKMPQDLPNKDDPLQPAPGTRPEYTPLEDHYRIDINSVPPEITEADWRLRISGMVDHPLTLTLDDLISRYDPMQQYVTLACISNSIGGDLTSTTRWTGASLQKVLADAGVQPGATHLRITSADGFYETVALDLVNEEPRIMLTYNWDGIPLLYKHGFPLRIYIPDHYGMKQPKWITDIEVMDHDEDGYWVERGWDKVAQMRATSVVDVAATDSVFEQDGTRFVPVGGIAHAGARGISKVEVKVDDGDWTEAKLRQPLSETTWVIWRYDWPFAEGKHTFRVHCYEGDGTPQIEEMHGTFPSGATGIHSHTVTV